MSSDFEGYEQDFAVLTAEITNKIARVPRLPPDEKKQVVANVEKQLEEAKELLEQMDLEVREIPPQSRGMYSNRMRSYKQEMGKLETDFKRSRIAYSDEVRNELLGDDGNSSENQLIKLREERAHLLDNTERLERSSRRLEAGYQIAVETEQIGQEMLENLSHDREKIQRARERLRETDANLGKSSRVLTGMLRRKRRKKEEKQVSRNRKRASLVAQWLRVRLPMQGTRVRALVWEDPTCRGAAGPMSHGY
ncbi:vesicle transport through interaction with t-SNAREs homolog 1A isoform X3 [Orcinus orca]|uniref:vesicle transport through interaction with t-SNAREs homolog 1A isoform X3 n=1 Tax=Orcinus orca TaxID=9733 RepID=UPI00211381C1|nr:vesicle transport through interaction with t-SNAREs homolog 1A isoform X3 [Orcinus orca]